MLSFTPVYKDILKITDCKTALYFGELYRQQERFGEWFYFSQSQIYEEIGLSKHDQKKAVKILTTLGLIEVRKFGMPPKNHFKIDVSAMGKKLTHLWEKYSTAVESKIDPLSNNDINNKRVINNNTSIGEIDDIFFYIFNIYSETFLENNIFTLEQLNKKNIAECFKQGDTYRFTYEEIKNASIFAKSLQEKYNIEVRFSKREIASLIRNKIDFEQAFENGYESLEELIEEEYHYIGIESL